MGAEINAKQSRFVDEYLIDLNATQAAIRAGYSAKTAGAQGFVLLKNAEIAAEIARRQKKRAKRTEITQDRVLKELERIAFSDTRRVVKWSGISVNVIDSETLSDDDAAAVSEVSQTMHGIKIKLHDKIRALELIGKHLGTFKDGAGSEEDAPQPMSIVFNVVDASVPRGDA